MHALSVLKQAALEAFDSEDGPGDLVGSWCIIDPQSEIGLVEIAETRITNKEVRALHQVIGALSNYVSRTSLAPEAVALVRHAQAVAGVPTR